MCFCFFAQDWATHSRRGREKYLSPSLRMQSRASYYHKFDCATTITIRTLVHSGPAAAGVAATGPADHIQIGFRPVTRSACEKPHCQMPLLPPPHSSTITHSKQTTTRGGWSLGGTKIWTPTTISGWNTQRFVWPPLLFFIFIILITYLILG